MSSRTYSNVTKQIKTEEEDDEGRNDEGWKKIVIGGLSTLLLVGIVIALVIAEFKKKRVSVDGVNEGAGQSLVDLPLYDGISIVCNYVDFKTECLVSFSELDTDGRYTPKELFLAALKSSMDAVIIMYNSTDKMIQETTNSTMLQGLSDCKALDQNSIDEIQSTINTVSSSNDDDPMSFTDHSDDLKNWLSASISYGRTCIDNVPDPESSVWTDFEAAFRLQSNALDIICNISIITEEFQSRVNGGKSSSPGPMPHENGLNPLDTDGSPSWLPTDEQKPSEDPNVVVAKDGSGHFKTISAALNAMPNKYSGRYVIYVKEGIYDEYVEVTKDMVNVLMYGDGPTATIVTGNKSVTAGYLRYRTPSFATWGDGFIAKSMGFRNTAGPKGRTSIALRVVSDRSAFFNCMIDGYQNTLFVQSHRQFYRNCVVSGTFSFIFGGAAAVLQNCSIVVKKPAENGFLSITWQGNLAKGQSAGIVIHNCKIVPDKELYPVRFKVPVYLGTTWFAYAKAAIMESTLDDLITPDGWYDWAHNPFGPDTGTYVEYANRGPGADTTRRVQWQALKLNTSRSEVLKYTVGSFIQGGDWLGATGVPYDLGLMN